MVVTRSVVVGDMRSVVTAGVVVLRVVDILLVVTGADEVVVLVVDEDVVTDEDGVMEEVGVG